MGRWVDGSMGRWVDGSLGRWVDGSMGRWVNGSLGQCVGRWDNGMVVGMIVELVGFSTGKICKQCGGGIDGG